MERQGREAEERLLEVGKERGWEGERESGRKRNIEGRGNSVSSARTAFGYSHACLFLPPSLPA